MKIKKDIQRLARRLFKLCFNAEQELDTSRFSQLLSLIEQKKPRNSLPLLFALKELFLHEERRRQATIYSADILSEESKNEIQSRLLGKYPFIRSWNWEVDSALLAGLRFQIGDLVIDGSLAQKIRQLSPLSPA